MYTRVQNDLPPIKLPWLFFVSTAVLFVSGYTLRQAKTAFEEDDSDGLIRSLKRTILLTVLFLVMQSFGWIELIQTGIPVAYSTLASYIYVISAAHLAHVVLGIPFLIIFYVKTKRRLTGDVKEMVFFADPDPRRHLRLLSIYWLFLDRLWIGLMLFFWLNFLLKDMSSLGI